MIKWRQSFPSNETFLFSQWSFLQHFCFAGTAILKLKSLFHQHRFLFFNKDLKEKSGGRRRNSKLIESIDDASFVMILHCYHKLWFAIRKLVFSTNCIEQQSGVSSDNAWKSVNKSLVQTWKSLISKEKFSSDIVKLLHQIERKKVHESNLWEISSEWLNCLLLV